MSESTQIAVTPSFPPSGGYLQAIRQSSRNLRTQANIMITKESIQRLLRSSAFRSSFKRVSAAHGLNLPLKFDSRLEELNLISVLSLLNFASGYRIPLHEQLHRGAWDTIRAFIFALYITSSSEDNLLSSRGMQAISLTKVAELMGVNLHVERPHKDIPGVVIGELGGPLYDLVGLVTQTLNETGSILVSGGYLNLGSFVLEALKEGERVQARGGVESIALEILVRAFPAFRDMAIVEGQPIYCFKKALFLIHAIRLRFGSVSPPPFPIPSTTESPIFTDNVIPSMLVHLGIIDISQASGLSLLFLGAGSEESLEQLLGPASKSESSRASPSGTSVNPVAPKAGPMLSNAQAFKLRAAAIDACEMIIEEAHLFDAYAGGGKDQDTLAWIREITLPELDMWIWSIAKDRPDYRALERFAQRDTVFY
ncbi:hypothetical protein P691DRAFT_724443 [Macrolepiota fuliginosa MF-IS2]|uniref:Queuosine 5'-phosphate N-glycosylase/hydrolase n=1 Tax=Macrolepiota fuliginosa MF-IS2 TaxID=1400762 RepID=A0A9P6C4H4_9AGAR|nr:hypothetical protein P691DRAFT_724443 [Macrolepiota fuliginosa MF-IS2]